MAVSATGQAVFVETDKSIYQPGQAVSIVAIASAGVAFAMRDSAQTQTEREAQRLSALLESARAQSRTSGNIPMGTRNSAQSSASQPPRRA